MSLQPWAETYSNGRLTGQTAIEPVYCANGDVASNWIYVGDMTEVEFNALFAEQLHDHCHSSTRPDFACAHCDAMGWN